MSSGFPGGGNMYGSVGIGGGSAVDNPIQMQYQRPDNGGGFLKRSLTEMERQQLQRAFFLRSVKQKSQQTSPNSPLSPIDLTSSGAFPSETPAVSNPAFSSSFAPRNGSYLFLQQQLLQQQRQYPSNYTSGAGYGYNMHSQQNPGPVNFSFAPPLPAAQAMPEKAATTMRSRLLELERHLLDDDDDEDEASVSGSVVTTSDWNQTMQSLLSSSSSSSQKPPSPSPTSSSSSSSCSSSSSVPSKQLLLDSASAIADGKIDTAASTLAGLKLSANPRGDPDQRLTAYLVAALHSRINPPAASEAPYPIAELCSGEHLGATHLLYEASPCFKLGFVAANLAILDTTRDHTKIHIVDFDIGQGNQYISLLQALADRPSGRPSVKITAVTDLTSPFSNPYSSNTTNSSKVAGDRLTKLAEQIGVGLRFNMVSLKTSDLSRAALGCEADEALAVNFAYMLYRMPDESVSPANPRDELLRRVKGLGPRVVTLVEQEMNGNTAPFAARFAEAAAHYGALFESLEATMARESQDRFRLEECLGRKAANSVAREGRERVERCEVFGKWRARMGMAGFQACTLGPGVADSVRARLATGRTNPGFTFKEEAGGLRFAWMGRTLTVASAWR